jgi:hypothetical protein
MDSSVLLREVIAGYEGNADKARGLAALSLFAGNTH